MVNTYNPRLAQALGKAEGNLFVDYAAPIKDVLNKNEQERLKEEESNYKKAIIEANAYQKAKKESEAVTARLAREMKDYDPAKVHPKYLKEATYSVNNLRNIARGIINNPELSEAERSIQLEEKFNQPLKKIYQKSEQLKQSDEDFLDSNDLLSKANNAFIIDFNNIKHDPEGYDIINDFAVIKLDKFDNKNQNDSDFKELVAKYKVGNNVAIPLDDFNEMHKPILQSWKKYKEVFDDIDAAAKSMASKGLTKPQFAAEIEKTTSALRFTPEEVKSIAYDHLGKNEEAFAGYDLNKDNKFDENELNNWVKDQLKTGAKTTYDNWFKADLPEDGGKPTVAEEKKKQIQQNITFATNELNKMNLPKTSKGMIDVGSTSFNRLLNNLNLSVDVAGSFDANGKQLIKVKSNLTNKTLNFTSDMTEAEFNRAVLLLSGALPEEAMKKYPDNQGPSEQNEVINIGSLPVKK